MRFHLPFLATILMLLTSCTPPEEVYNFLVRNLTDDPPVTVSTVKVGEFVEAAVKAVALFPPEGTILEKTATVTIGVVLQLDDKLSCPALPQTSLPSGVVLENGSSLTKQFDLVVQRGQTINFSHTLRFTSMSAQKVAVLVGMWGKASSPRVVGDPDWEPVRLLVCKPLNPIPNSSNGGTLPQTVTFQ